MPIGRALSLCKWIRTFMWLFPYLFSAALATFTGALCKKYQFDLAGILQYVLNQLKAGRRYDFFLTLNLSWLLK